jgi:hypothetical protein
MVVQAPDGRKIGRLEANVTYFLSAQAGETQIRFTPTDRATTVSAKAEFTAVRQEDAFGAVTALVLALAGRQDSGRSSLRLSNVRVEGDLDAIRDHVDAIGAWWDEQAGIAVADYVSPVLSSAHIGKLLLNVWGTEAAPTPGLAMHGYAVIMFDPGNPGLVSGGRIMRRDQSGGFTVVDLPHPHGGFLAPIIDTPTPNDYLLTIGTGDGSNSRAELLIDVLPDGTFDVRGAATRWVIRPGAFSVEGVGNTKFVAPGS